MITSSLPLDIKELLTVHIESVGQLEALYQFFKNPKSQWSALSLSRELRNNETFAKRQIECFLRSQFIIKTTDESYIYSPENEELHQTITHLFNVYSSHQVAVISFIYEKPTDKLKGFADAFKLKKD